MDAPVVAVSDDGRKLGGAWMDMRGGRGDRDVQWTAGSVTSLPKEQRVNDDERGNQGHPSLAFDQGQQLWCAWEDDRSGTQRIYVAGATGRRNVPVSDEAEGRCGFPSLVATGVGLGVGYESAAGVVFRTIAAK